ncbi:zinc-binding dehydrogenase [Streptomyces sp. NPDC004609]|uniref:zinc-binding dehydrogenase n=1 Tax=Streptomyces sp. NPDC004609 TaxID=3364704 RepID=UPI003697D9A9
MDAVRPGAAPGGGRTRPRVAGGFDDSFEAVGRPGTLRAAYDATRLGGSVILVGTGSRTAMTDIGVSDLFVNERRILPAFSGGHDVRRPSPRSSACGGRAASASRP